MTREQMQDLAALHALGALEGEDLVAWQNALANGSKDALAEQAAMRETAALIASARSAPRPLPPGLKARVMAQIFRTPQAKPLAPPPASGQSQGGEFSFVLREEGAWFPAPAPGGRFKRLSFNQEVGYAVLFMELPPGSRFPEHSHVGHEEIYLISGDLQTEGRCLKPGDFLHAEPGSHHSTLYTEHGCTALLVLPLAALAG
jgi:anti-sigma factor ChrR (cupin superfamily)